VNDKLERKRSWSISSYRTGVSLEGLEKITITSVTIESGLVEIGKEYLANTVLECLRMQMGFNWLRTGFSDKLF
jgi:hypothetical protein